MSLTFLHSDISHKKALQGKFCNLQNMRQFHYPPYAILSALYLTSHYLGWVRLLA